MSTLTLYKDYSYTGQANAAPVSAGAELMTGHKDTAGGVFAVTSGAVVAAGVTPQAAVQDFLFFDTVPPIGSGTQRIVLTGVAGKDLAAVLRLRPAASASPLPGGYLVSLTHENSPGLLTLSRLPLAGEAGRPPFLGYAPFFPAWNPAHLYQMVAEVTEGTIPIFTVAAFDLTAPPAGQPLDPVRTSDVGAVCLFSVSDPSAPQPVLVPFPFAPPGTPGGQFALAASQSGPVGVSRARLYAPPFTATAGWVNPGAALRSGSATFSAAGQVLHLSGFGWTVAAAAVPGYNIPSVVESPTFTSSFTNAAGDSGTATTITGQKVTGTGTADVFVSVGTGVGTLTVTDPATGLSVAVPVSGTYGPGGY